MCCNCDHKHQIYISILYHRWVKLLVPTAGMMFKRAQRNNAMKRVLVPNRFPRYLSSSSNQTSGEGKINAMNQKLRAMNQKLNALEEKLSNTKSTTTKLTKASVKLDATQFSAIKKINQRWFQIKSYSNCYHACRRES